MIYVMVEKNTFYLHTDSLLLMMHTFITRNMFKKDKVAEIK